MLKQIIIAAFIALPLTAFAADDKGDKKANPQNTRMAACNKEANDKGLTAANKKGDERKKFMSECLGAAKKTQQDKMASCNKDANDKGLTAANKKGDERKKFMSECLRA